VFRDELFDVALTVTAYNVEPVLPDLADAAHMTSYHHRSDIVKNVKWLSDSSLIRFQVPLFRRYRYILYY